MPQSQLLTLVLSLALAVLVGWLLVIGKSLLLPVFTAIIAVYILVSCAASLRRVPVIGDLPSWALHLAVLVIFTMMVLAFGLVVTVTLQQLFEVAPTYQDNLERIVTSVSDLFGTDSRPTWDDVRAVTLDRISLPGLLGTILASFTSFGATMFLVVVYAAFLMAERGSFRTKLALAFPKGDQADQLAETIAEINRKIGDYLAVKTGVNAVLAAISFVIMWIMDVDFALFWAIVIGLTNYVPYVGSLAGVAMPVLLSVAQFGQLGTTLLLAVLLTGAQTYVGNVLEPRWIGKQLDLSPFVVLLALSLWSALWGLPGAILAIPMTSIMVILFAAFPATRFAAVLLSGAPEDNANQTQV